jgi:hypothetical protein
MTDQLIANILVLFHLLFIIFVIFGGFLVLRWRNIFWLHIPCAIWGVLIEFAGWLCPLTPMENHFRQLAGQAGYYGGFIDHYILPVIYPTALTREIQYILGIGVITINLIAYGLVLYRIIKKDRNLIE